MTTVDPRTRILHAAGPIFAEKGYEAATVREICHAAGVNLAAINYYFGGKENLYMEALTLAHPGKFGLQPDFQWPEGTPPEDKLKGFIHAMLTHLLGRQTAAWQERLLMREIMDPTPVFLERLREHFRIRFSELQQILDEILPADTPPHKRHQIGFSIIGQCVHYRSGRRILPLIVGEEELEAYYGIDQLAEHISEVSLAALGLGPPLARPSEATSDPCESTPGVGEHSAVSVDQAGGEGT